MPLILDPITQGEITLFGTFFSRVSLLANALFEKLRLLHNLKIQCLKDDRSGRLIVFALIC